MNLSINRRSVSIGLVCSIAGLIWPFAAQGRATSFNAIQFRPSPFTDKIITLDGSSLQRPGQAMVGLDLDFSKGTMARTPSGGAKQDVIDNLLVAHLLVSGGLFSWLSAGIEFPVALYEQFISPTTLATDTRTRLGDLSFALKIEALSKARHPVGLAVLPFVTFPTGSGSSFTGNNSFAGGLKIAVDREFAHGVEATMNLGYLARNEVNILGTDIADRFLYGVGASWRCSRGLTILGELQGSTVVNNAFQSKAQSPLEVDLGVRYEIPRSAFTASLSGGAGIVKNSGAPIFRVASGVEYHFGMPAQKPAQEEGRLDLYQDMLQELRRSVYFDHDSIRLTDTAKDELKSVSELLQRDELTTVIIVAAGYADDTGGSAVNEAISRLRAKAVRDHLIGLGIGPKRVVIVGFGEDDPVGDNATPEGRAQNRRVEIHIGILDHE